MTIQTEIEKVLPSDLDPAQVTDFLKIHSSPAGALGETFLIRYAARWLAVYRESMLDEHETIALDRDDPCSLEKGTFQSTLTFHAQARDIDDVTIDVSALDLDRVENFLGLEELLESVKEAEERLSAPPGTIAKFPSTPTPTPTPAPIPTPAPSEEPATEEQLFEEEARDDEDVEEELALVDETPSGSGEEALEELGLDPRLEGELVGYLKMGHRGVAMSRLRGATGVGMVEAQELIDALARVERVKAPTANTFWWRVFWILIVLAGLIAYYRFIGLDG